MVTERYITSGYKIYDTYTGREYLLNNVDAKELTKHMNNLDTKARERSKALSKLQLENNKLKKDFIELCFMCDKYYQMTNELLEDAKRFVDIIKSSITTEKTAFGRMILKQLMDKLGVDYD